MENTLSKSSWQSYRRRRTAIWIFMPVFFAVMSIQSLISSGWITFLAFTPAMICLFAMQWYKCPKCGETFFHNGIWWQPWVTSCLHCGLPKWKEADYVKPDSGRLAYRTSSIAEMAADSAIPTLERNSIFLTLVLRDDPGAIHLILDSDGWADLQNLLTRANRYGFKLTREDLADILTVSGEHSFEWDQPGDRIRVRR
jgi:hypothetical protein